MNTNTPRNYSCKDEELPVICRYSAINIKRDLTDFTRIRPNSTGNMLPTMKPKFQRLKNWFLQNRKPAK